MKEQLQEISQKSQAETIDLWPDIYAELKETKTVKTPIRMNFLPRLVAVLSLFFVGALVAYAISQIYVDTGLEGERAERLVTPINLSVTQDDITIVVDWAYADLNRVTLAYRVLDAEGNTYVPENGRHQFSWEIWIAEPNWDTIPMRYITGFTANRAFTFYRGDREQEIVNFTGFSVQMPESVREEMRIDFKVFWEQGKRPLFITFPLQVSPLQFEAYNVAIESNSVPSVIQELGISPTNINLSLCLEVPEEYQRDRGQNWESDWVARGLKIYFDDVDIALLYPDVTGLYTAGAGLIGDVYSGEPMPFMHCNSLELNAPLDTMPQRVRLHFDEWLEDRSSNFDTMEEAELMAGIFLEHGLELDYWGDVDSDKFFEASRFISDSYWELSPFEAQATYDEILGDYCEQSSDCYRIPGPWEIEFQVSEPIN